MWTVEPPGRRLPLWVAAAVAAAGAWACRTPEPAGRDALVRLLEHPPGLQLQSAAEPSQRAGLVNRWEGEALEREWTEENDGQWVTRRSPRLGLAGFGQLARVEIRVSGPQGVPSTLLFLWSDNPSLSESDLLRNKLEPAAHPLAGGGYRLLVSGESLQDLNAFLPAQREARPRHFFLRYPARSRLRVESIRIEEAGADLHSSSWGRGRWSFRGEVRDAAFAHTPASLLSPLPIAGGEALSLGVKGLRREGVLTLRVRARTPEGGERLLLEETLPFQPGWADFRIRLERPVTRVWLEAFSSADADVVLWSNPMIVPPPRPDDPPNVILYVIDGLRADQIGARPRAQAAAPFLERLFARGVHFENAYAAASWTKPSVTSMLTSLYPAAHGIGGRTYGDALPESVPTLQDAFRAGGYVTASFSANPFSSTLSNLDQGFDTAYTPNAFHEGPDEGKIRSDRLNRYLLPWLEQHRDQRFFLFVHSMDPHPPFPPLPGGGRPAGTKWEQYRAAIRFNDRQLERIQEKLEELQIASRTLWVVTSDHGQSFGEQGREGHGLSVHQEQVRVPLAFVHPARLAPGVRTDNAHHVDLLPTILAHCSLPAGPGAIAGRELLRGPSGPGRALLLDRYLYPRDSDVQRYRDSFWVALIQGRWKLACGRQPDAAAACELFDLERDPFEETDLSSSHGEQAAELKQALLALLRGQMRIREDLLRRHVHAGEPGPVLPDRETLRRLEALGYVR